MFMFVIAGLFPRKFGSQGYVLPRRCDRYRNFLRKVNGLELWNAWKVAFTTRWSLSYVKVKIMGHKFLLGRLLASSRLFTKVSSWPCFYHPWKISSRTPATTSIARIWTPHWNPGSIGIQESLCPIIWLRWCWEMNGNYGFELNMV